MSERIIQLTEELFKYNHIFMNHFLVAREKNTVPDFEKEVRPFADEVKIVNDEWCKLVKEWIDENSPKLFNKRQVESIHEQIESYSMHCFYPNTSKPRFLNTQKTVEYFLTGIKKELKNK
ncbi:MAG: DUF1798 family protein [Bacillota bacterium]|nr:DUF1798 family protein [Bacillota bacterium]